MKSKIVLLGAMATVVAIIVGVIFMVNNQNIVEASNEISEKKTMRLPTINIEAMK